MAHLRGLNCGVKSHYIFTWPSQQEVRFADPGAAESFRCERVAEKKNLVDKTGLNNSGEIPVFSKVYNDDLT